MGRVGTNHGCTDAALNIQMPGTAYEILQVLPGYFTFQLRPTHLPPRDCPYRNSLGQARRLGKISRELAQNYPSGSAKG